MNPLALVVENDVGTRKLLAVLLDRIGFDADVVATAPEAMLLLERIEYDAILVDLLLPDTGGTAIVGWLSREQPEALRRVIVLSSALPAQIQKACDLWPEVRAFRKPFELGELVAAAREAVSGRTRGVTTAAEQFVRDSVCCGASAGVVVRVNHSVIEPVFHFGYPPGVVESSLPLPVEAPLPLCAAVRHGRPVWLASVTVATIEYPMLAPVFEHSESRALAVVPLLRDGVVLGAAGWSFRQPRLFTEPEQQAFIAVAASLLPAFPREDEQPVIHARA